MSFGAKLENNTWVRGNTRFISSVEHISQMSAANERHIILFLLYFPQKWKTFLFFVVGLTCLHSVNYGDAWESGQIYWTCGITMLFHYFYFQLNLIPLFKFHCWSIKKLLVKKVRLSILSFPVLLLRQLIYTAWNTHIKRSFDSHVELLQFLLAYTLRRKDHEWMQNVKQAYTVSE